MTSRVKQFQNGYVKWRVWQWTASVMLPTWGGSVVGPNGWSGNALVSHTEEVKRRYELETGYQPPQGTMAIICGDHVTVLRYMTGMHRHREETKLIGYTLRHIIPNWQKLESDFSGEEPPQVYRTYVEHSIRIIKPQEEVTASHVDRRTARRPSCSCALKLKDWQQLCVKKPWWRLCISDPRHCSLKSLSFRSVTISMVALTVTLLRFEVHH